MLAQNYQCDKAKTDRWAGREGVREELRHEKIIQCPCGTALRDENEDKLVPKAQQHANALHSMELTREQALAMAKPA